MFLFYVFAQGTEYSSKVKIQIQLSEKSVEESLNLLHLSQ